MKHHLCQATARRVKALLACGVLLGTGAIGTTALWSTTATTSSNVFTTAKLEIQANEKTGADTANLTFSGDLLPGSTTAAMINVKNTGTVSLTYIPSVQATTTSVTSVAQYTALKAVVMSDPNAAVASATTGTVCPTGTQLVSSQNVTMTKTGFTGVTARPLAAGSAAERLCVQLTVRMDAPNDAAGQTDAGTVKFTFEATG